MISSNLKMTLTFITGNTHKAKEAAAIIDCQVQAIDLEEIQSLDPEEVITHKLEQAHGKVPEPYFVDDVSVSISNTEFPGPFIKHMLHALGKKGILKCAQGLGSTKAVVTCTIGMMRNGKKEFHTGTITGTLVEPRGENGFGFDPIFQPDGQGKTFAEMTAEEKNLVSHRRKALEAMKKHL